MAATLHLFGHSLTVFLCITSGYFVLLFSGGGDSNELPFDMRGSIPKLYDMIQILDQTLRYLEIYLILFNVTLEFFRRRIFFGTHKKKLGTSVLISLPKWVHLTLMLWNCFRLLLWNLLHPYQVQRV